ncbi:MAG TPA: hypothetical protein VMT57_01675 [Candidatus Thermoplasmatota archaeon]|nr:hypothetical protein [Candidatus Thermoplasmatota archaeon]
MRKKATFAIGITVLFIALAFQAAALSPTPTCVETSEINAVDTFMDVVEQAASQSTSSHEFYNKLVNLCTEPQFQRFHIIQEILSKILGFMTLQDTCFLKGTPFGNFMDKVVDRLLPNERPDYLVISYGVYKRFNPLKQNTMTRLKPGLSMWRYSGDSLFMKGRTLVIERQPFGIHQRITGAQLGLMRGFKGIYFDHESKLTGNSYIFFIGHASRIRVFDLTPFH